MDRVNDPFEVGDGEDGGGEAVVSAEDGMAYRAFGFFGLQGIRRGSVLKIADLT
jgi:hypothetical protein